MIANTTIQQNIVFLRNRIEEACKRVNREPSEVTLVAVSKTKPISMIHQAIDAGEIEFGENKVQDLCEKMDTIQAKLNWHMIGHLQTNKVKYLVGKNILIHSVDSFRLAEQINQLSAIKEQIQEVLIEVNIGDEVSKYGVSSKEVMNLVEQIAALPFIRIRGLMCVAPYTERAEDNRVLFKKMRQLLVDINAKNIDNRIKGMGLEGDKSSSKVTLDILSMGMSNDYEIAIEEGATLIRVGTGIFGVR